MQTLSTIREALRERGLAPRKSLGQNFLIDQNLVRKLVEASGVQPGGLVLEVGPGTGVLTDALLDADCEVVACELDAGLAAMLRDRLAGHPRFTLVEGDCLASKKALSPELAAALDERAFRLVANLPYGAATPLMMTLMMGGHRCESMAVTIQREVADRLAATPGTKAYGSISALAALTHRVERIATLPPECFWPRPDVTSVMVGLFPLASPPSPEDRSALIDACRVLFASRRKQLGGVLKRLSKQRSRAASEGDGAGLPGQDPIDSAELDPMRRVESLTPTELLALARRLR